MTPREIKNIPASVHQRLLDRARKSGRPFNSLLQYYAMERFLYRLSESPHADSFLLKGALMLQVWRAPVLRHTLDIDLLGRVDNDTANIATIVRGVCAQSVPDDGMSFDPDAVNVAPITADAEYVGVRATFKGSLGKARVPMQIDIGIGDFVVGAAEIETYPVLLDFPAPRLRGYSRETSVSEKFHAMIERGRLNSRIKDYFDIWLLARHFEFDGPTLASAIRHTMDRRGATLPEEPEGLQPSYAETPGRAQQWRKFVARNHVKGDVPELIDVVAEVALFLAPAAAAVRSNSPFEARRSPGGPWLLETHGHHA